MDKMDTSQLVQELVAGFEQLAEEYRKLFGQHQSLERKLATAREQYNELVKFRGSGAETTPPLSLASSPPPPNPSADTLGIAEILETRQSRNAAQKVRDAITAAQILRQQPASRAAEGGSEWYEALGDKPEQIGSAGMPSIWESPLEQDFTIEGKPSKLGCPFASMATRKLSSHAANVLSRYNTRESATGAVLSSAPMSPVSRTNGNGTSRRESRRASFIDPIKAEICGLSDHNQQQQPEAAGASHTHAETHDNVEVGVCPIRFLDQHSPEEVATYFEKHKHELPRSHEFCVRRYQSNEEQLKHLDAKYGNMVSMIQGLGAKHKDYLPEEPEPVEVENETAVGDARSNDKVQKWASSVVADAGEEAICDEGDNEADERQPHFARPLRDIRVGESPSRPWGIPVPAKYLDVVESRPPSEPAQVASSPALTKSPQPEAPLPQAEMPADHPPLPPHPVAAGASAAQCPFHFLQKKAAAPEVDAPPDTAPPAAEPEVDVPPDPAPPVAAQSPDDVLPGNGQEQASIVAEPPAASVSARSADTNDKPEGPERPQMVFTGPVFIGYGAADAARILRDSGFVPTANQ